jgi:hypothetical protein
MAAFGKEIWNFERIVRSFTYTRMDDEVLCGFLF